MHPDEFKALERAILDQVLEGTLGNTAAAVARELALIYLLSDTGLRCGEVCAMTIDDIDFERGVIRVCRGKGHKQRVLNVEPSDDLAM